MAHCKLSPTARQSDASASSFERERMAATSGENRNGRGAGQMFTKLPAPRRKLLRVRPIDGIIHGFGQGQPLVELAKGR